MQSESVEHSPETAAARRRRRGRRLRLDGLRPIAARNAGDGGDAAAVAPLLPRSCHGVAGSQHPTLPTLQLTVHRGQHVEVVKPARGATQNVLWRTQHWAEEERWRRVEGAYKLQVRAWITVEGAYKPQVRAWRTVEGAYKAKVRVR